MWKDFFYFTKTERQGIIVLVVLIIGVSSAPKISQYLNDRKDRLETDSVEIEKFEHEYNRFIASMEEVKNRKYETKKTSSEYQQQEVILRAFDPNTADSLTFLSLGIPPWMIKNILHYRRKQGKFRQPEDFQKIYGLTEEQYQTLRPYIHLQIATISSKDTTQLITKQEARRDTIVKYQPGTILNLNVADTTELKKIPGIGSRIAQLIVSYRSKLGAFYRIEQLKEIHLKAEKLRPWFAVDASLIRRINVNKASLERMMRHPYINYYQARVIVEYRKKKGKINTLKQLSLYEEFTSEDLERLTPYICYD